MFGKITEIIDNYVYVENSTHELKNNILKSLVIVNFIGLISELLCSYAAFNIKKMPILSNLVY